MKPTQLYRLEVAPLVILPLARAPFFSYLSSSPVAIGSYINIPFGKRSIEGIVFDCAPLPGPPRLGEAGKPPVWMKFADKIIEEKFLTHEQLELAQYVSEEYFTPLGKTLKHFLPHRVKARKKRPEHFSQTIKKLSATKTEINILKSFTAAKNNFPLFLDTSSIENPHRLLVHIAKKIISQKRQTLFLVPEATLLPEWEASFLQHFPSEKVAVLSSQLADGPYFETWEKIRSGEVNIILSTRQGLFAPFRNLGLVTVLEEQDESYKQWDMSPRYHSKRVAEYLAKLHNAKFLLASSTPSIESYYHIKNNNYVSLVSISHKKNFKENIEIVNLRLERFKKNYSPLSRTLVDAIRCSLNERKQILLYIHRQGMNAFSVCENCKNIFRCPESGHILTGTKEGAFRCLACGYKTGSFPNCPHCGHLSFKSIGFGTEQVEREVLKLFPFAKVFRADGSTIHTLKDTQELYEKARLHKIDILVGTQMILKGPTLPKLALVGMIDADSLLAFPDFRADEKLLHILTRAVRQTSASHNDGLKPGQVVVQTFHPESAFFQRISTLDSEAIAKQMLAEREDLFYPPFSRLISIVCQGKTVKSAETTAQTLHQSLKKFFHDGNARYRLSPPQPATKKTHQKVFQSALLLRTPSKPLAENIKSFLRKNNFAYIIDVDPISFF
jgi:primosomal protein N' (replication factor Y) (superfamily II helicase)